MKNQRRGKLIWSSARRSRRRRKIRENRRSKAILEPGEGEDEQQRIFLVLPPVLLFRDSSLTRATSPLSVSDNATRASVG